jgi:hypothetical protein
MENFRCTQECEQNAEELFAQAKAKGNFICDERKKSAERKENPFPISHRLSLLDHVECCGACYRLIPPFSHPELFQESSRAV